mmetsp:Transcript_1249/g.3000  ORF Transcript_1249/g.3000 Transcript_1249/m.3000 type:complete len:81 (-) Transcript_1249:1973-2215(-)
MCLPARLGAVRSCKVWVQILNKPRAMVAVAAMHVKCVERHQCPGQEGGSLSVILGICKMAMGGWIYCEDGWRVDMQMEGL